MGKLEKIIESGVFIGDPAFNSLLNDFLASKATAAFQKGKSKALRKEAAKGGSKKAARFALEMNALKAWHEQKICEADQELSKFQLKNWLREQAKAAKKEASIGQKAELAKTIKTPKAQKIDKQPKAEIDTLEAAAPEKAASAKTPKAKTVKKNSPAAVETTTPAPADSRRVAARRSRATARKAVQAVPVN